jgi:hypothetical protein
MADLFSMIEKNKILELYHQTHSYASTQRKFCTHFGIKRKNKAPSILGIKNLVKKFKNEGRIDNKKTGPKTKKIRTEFNINTVASLIATNGQMSTRKLSNITEISQSSIFRRF